MKKSKEEKEETILDDESGIWKDIKDRQMSLFGLPQEPISKYFRLKFSTKDSLLLEKTTNASAAVSFLEETLNSWIDRSGSTHREEKFSVEINNDGSIQIKQIKRV